MVLRRAEHILLLICSSTYVCMSMMTTHAFSFSHQHARGVEPFLTTRTTRGSSSPLFVAITPEDAVSPNLEERTNNVRKQLRRLTGFSLTAARATLRVTTGVSSQVTKRTLSIFPLWLRFFFQPFLVLYYWPLILLRGGSGQNQSKQAVDVGEQTKTTSTAVEEESNEVSSNVLESSSLSSTVAPVPAVPEASKTIKDLVMAEIDQLVQSTTTATTAAMRTSKSKVSTPTITAEIATSAEEQKIEIVEPVIPAVEVVDLATSPDDVAATTTTPSGSRWSVSSRCTDLSGTWSLIADDAFKVEYDTYLSSLGQPAIVRSVACTCVGFTKEEYRQTDEGKELTIIGTNPRGKWERVLLSSEESGRIETPVQTADSETVMAEAWWEEQGAKHKSWMRGGKKWGGGDFESTRYLEDGMLVCDTVFHPTDEFREKSRISWRFRKVE